MAGGHFSTTTRLHLNVNTETTPTRLFADNIKLGIALLLLILAVGGFYYYVEGSLLLRVVSLLAAILVSVLIALQTDWGRQTKQFFTDAQVEVRKVVWPNRQETTQVTLAVSFMVVLAALMLWGMDAVLGWLTGMLLGIS